MTAPPHPNPRPEQAIAARHRAAQAKTASVTRAIKTLARTGAPITCAGIARLAGVSRSFLYENDQARALITAAQARTQARTAGTAPAASQQESSWRERALNAEQRARDQHHELTAQRRLTAGLLGQLRQPDGTWLADENTRLRQQNEQLLTERNELARERNNLQRKLDAARANLARLTEQRVTTLFPHGPGQAPGSGSAPASTSHLPPAPAPQARQQRTRNDMSRTCPPHTTPTLTCANTTKIFYARRKVDEAHGYKNLRTASNIPDASIDGSQRASDLDMKISYLRRRNGKRVVTFATATPIANSVTEAYVMQRYLRPDLLDDAGISVFDTWAATFGQVVTQVELAPEGGGNFRIKSRFARFANTPEMLRMLHVAADIKTAEDLNLPVPDIRARDDGTRVPEIVTVEPSGELLSYVADLGDRAEKVRSRAVGADEDNILKISGDGRRAALDLRLVGLEQQTPAKTAIAAERITAIWRQNRDREYQAPDGTPYPAKGSLQLVFCDLGTPGPGWNVYEDLRQHLTERGLPRDSIRFIHEAKTDRDKAQLFAACRSGRVAVLVGSTEKMGVGTNVQDRAIALHHLDAPWRPADVAQREGRIIRQGNLNPEVQILRYCTAQSFDGYSWQTLERKAKFIAQVMHGRLESREISDIGDTALSFSEVKALATGNPLLMDKAEADAALTRLQRAERAWHRNQNSLQQAIEQHEDDIKALTRETADIDLAISRRQDTRGEAFTMTVGDQRHRKRADAGQHLKNQLGQEINELHGLRARTTRLGSLGGFTLTASIETSLGNTHAILDLDGVPASAIRLSAADIRAADPAGLVTRIENRLHRLETRRQEDLAHISQARREITHARHSLGQPFPQAAELTEARATARHIDDQLDQIVADSQRKDPEPEPQPQPAFGVLNAAAEARLEGAASSDWRDQVIRSGADRWMPRPVPSPDPGAGRSAEHGSPEPGR